MVANLSILVCVLLLSKSSNLITHPVNTDKSPAQCWGTGVESTSRSELSDVLTRRSFVASIATLPVALGTSACAAPTNHSPRFNLDSPVGKETLSTLQESISGLVAGSTLTLTKSLVKYPLDTATVRLQMPGSTYSLSRPVDLFEGAYRGIVPPLVANVPAGAVFFAVKDAAKSFLRSRWGASSGSGTHLSPILQTCLAVGLAQFPYWIVRNPSEVVKTRQQAGVDGFGEGVSTWQAYNSIRIDALRNVNATDANRIDALRATLNEFYVGYWENILYAYPADVVKFVCYDLLTSGRQNALSPAEGAWAGALSTAFAQLVTTPLDVVRNRVMCQAEVSDRQNANETSNAASNSYIDTLLKLAKEEGLSGLFAGAAPRVSKAFLSGAIQFATYEETKQAVGKLLLKK